MVQMSPYLIFNGDCAEAFSFYEGVLGGRTLVLHRHEAAGTVAHASLEVGACSLMGSDAPAGDDRATGRRVYVAVSVAAADAERIFRALAEGGQVTMPFENTFWSPGFGMLIDRFGTPWMVSTDLSA